MAGKRIIQTLVTRTITVREENAAAAMEVMSRFAMDPRWLVDSPLDDGPNGDLDTPCNPPGASAERRR